MSHKKKVLITGGAGFIGSNVADAYLAEGHKVVIVDNLACGAKNNIPDEAIFYNADILELDSIKKVFEKEKPDVVNHHAAIAEVIKSLKDPSRTYEVNLLGTVNVLMASGEAGVGKVIFISTGGAIYGDQEKLPISETAEPRPLSPYALSKLLGEETVKFYAKEYGFDYTVLRYGNIYGPRQNPKGEGGVVAIFSDLMLRDEQPIIFGEGDKSRDYVNVADVCRANVLALDRGENEIINIGTGARTTDQEVFDTIAEATNFKGSPEYRPSRKGEVSHSVLDARKAERLLGWKSEISFTEGVRKYIARLKK